MAKRHHSDAETLQKSVVVVRDRYTRYRTTNDGLDLQGCSILTTGKAAVPLVIIPPKYGNQYHAIGVLISDKIVHRKGPDLMRAGQFVKSWCAAAGFGNRFQIELRSVILADPWSAKTAKIEELANVWTHSFAPSDKKQVPAKHDAKSRARDALISDDHLSNDRADYGDVCPRCWLVRAANGSCGCDA